MGFPPDGSRGGSPQRASAAQARTLLDHWLATSLIFLNLGAGVVLVRHMTGAIVVPLTSERLSLLSLFLTASAGGLAMSLLLRCREFLSQRARFVILAAAVLPLVVLDITSLAAHDPFARGLVRGLAVVSLLILGTIRREGSAHAAVGTVNVDNSPVRPHFVGSASSSRSINNDADSSSVAAENLDHRAPNADAPALSVPTPNGAEGSNETVPIVENVCHDGSLRDELQVEECDPSDGEADMDEIEPDQWQQRFVREDGTHEVSGGMTVVLPAGERAVTQHVSFHPPLPFVPAATLLTDDDGVSAKAVAFRHGLRIELKRRSAVPEQHIRIEYHALAAPQSRRACA